MTYKFPCQVLVTMNIVMQVARSKTCIAFYRSNTGIVGSNPLGAVTYVCVLFCCLTKAVTLRRTEPLSKQALQTCTKTPKTRKMGGTRLHWTVVSQRQVDEEADDFVINIYQEK